jgi:TPR repeat protein
MKSKMDRSPVPSYMSAAFFLALVAPAYSAHYESSICQGKVNFDYKDVSTLEKDAQSDGTAQFLFARLYDPDLPAVSAPGHSKAYAASFEWYEKAAESGCGSAEYNLGASYNNGQGVPKDLEKGFEWTLKAAERGLSIAQSKVAESYLFGKGVEKDLDKAQEWAEKSLAQGTTPHAQQVLNTINAEREKEKSQAASKDKQEPDNADAEKNDSGKEVPDNEEKD